MKILYYCDPFSMRNCSDITTFGGTLQFLYFPSEYKNAMDCAYRIRVSSGKTIRLTFKEFRVEPEFDYITVSFFYFIFSTITFFDCMVLKLW